MNNYRPAHVRADLGLSVITRDDGGGDGGQKMAANQQDAETSQLRGEKERETVKVQMAKGHFCQCEVQERGPCFFELDPGLGCRPARWVVLHWFSHYVTNLKDIWEKGGWSSVSVRTELIQSWGRVNNLYAV